MNLKSLLALGSANGRSLIKVVKNHVPNFVDLVTVSKSSLLGSETMLSASKGT